MNAASILARLRELGITAEVRGAGLALRPASVIPGDLLAELKAHKVELLALLAANERDGWGLTGADRAAASARLNARTKTVITSKRPLQSLENTDALPMLPDSAPDTVATCIERAASGASDAAVQLVGARARTAAFANRQIADGYRRAALQRPPSWWRSEAHRPTPDATCSCCGGQRWWSRDRRGWCCRECHPPNDPAEFYEEQT